MPEIHSSPSVVGLIVPDASNPFFGALVEAFQKRLTAHQLGTLIMYTEGSPDREIESLSQVRGLGAVAVVIVSAGDNKDTFLFLRDFPIPTIVLDREIPLNFGDVLVTNNAHGSRMIVEYLSGLGHRRIAYLGGCLTTEPGRERLRGFTETCEEKQIEITGRYEGNFSFGCGVVAGKEIWSTLRSLRPTAIVAANDLSALGCMRELASHGVAIPKELSIVGFDDIMWATWSNPRLTTVRQDVNDLAREGVQLLMRRLANIESGISLDRQVRVVDVDLIVRESSTRADSTVNGWDVERPSSGGDPS